ncbi:MAG: hypothetical protein OXB88_10220, partial [Bacteriovoracales bacterium]|nr:hypothetical protein [Bacteriovoracales bacterium]
KGKVTVLHPDKIGRRQRGATEACFLHVARKRRGSRLPRLPGGEQLRLRGLVPWGPFRASPTLKIFHGIEVFPCLELSLHYIRKGVVNKD